MILLSDECFIVHSRHMTIVQLKGIIQTTQFIEKMVILASIDVQLQMEKDTYSKADLTLPFKANQNHIISTKFLL